MNEVRCFKCGRPIQLIIELTKDPKTQEIVEKELKICTYCAIWGNMTYSDEININNKSINDKEFKE